MSSDVLSIFRMYIDVGYTFMTSFHLPGIGVTPLTLTLFGTLTIYGVHFLKKALNYD